MVPPETLDPEELQVDLVPMVPKVAEDPRVLLALLVILELMVALDSP